MKVYVINLPEAIERRERVTVELAKTGLSYEFITPETSPPIENETHGWTRGANSLRLTTIKLIEQAIADDEDMIWIWEDDSLVNEVLFNQIAQHLPTIYEVGFDFVHLNWSLGGVHSLQSIGPFRKTISGVYCCQSYIIHKDVYASYLERLQNLVPIDESTRYLHKTRTNSYIAEPPPVMHEPSKYSYIRRDIVNY